MKLSILLACLFAAVPGHTAAQPQKPDAQAVSKYSVAEMQAAVSKLRATIQDRLTTEDALAEAQRDLQIFRARANELATANTSKKDASGPTTTLLLEIRDLLATLDGKLGAPASTAPAGRNGLPVPVFDDRRELADLANKLRAAQSNLREHLRGTNADAQKTEALLAEMIGAEERLAWAAGWPFTPEETAEIRLIRGSKASDVDRRIAQLYGGRRARGVSRVNAQLSHEAESVGRATPAPFVIHRPTTQGGQRIVDRRLAEWLSTELGVTLQPDSPALIVLARGTRRFDEAVVAALRNR